MKIKKKDHRNGVNTGNLHSTVSLADHVNALCVLCPSQKHMSW